MQIDRFYLSGIRPLWLLVLLSSWPIGGALAAEAPAPAAAAAARDLPAGTGDPNVWVRKGVRVEFSAEPAVKAKGAEVLEGDYVRVRFKITGAEDGKPVTANFPGAWMDLAKAVSGPGTPGMDCKARVGMYLQGTVGIRPMADLNSYFILVMNRSPVITVIDPFVGVTGITNLFASVQLKSAGADWTKTADERRLFVSMPQSGRIAEIDLDKFKLIRDVEAGTFPLRVALQPDERYLWVGNDAPPGEDGGVTVLDSQTLEPVARITTGQGHHELAFSEDSRYAYVTNRDSSTVSIIDVQGLKRVKDIAFEGKPISLGYSPLSRSLYVADGENGRVSVLDRASGARIAEIDTKPGLGPMRLTPDGRWVLVVNTAEDVLEAIDASVNQLAREVKVEDQPYQVALSRDFAYVRSLGSERVSMVRVSDLTKADAPVVSFPAGKTPPKKAGDVSIADTMVASPQEASMLVVSPADATVYFYMEGMNAPKGAFRNYGEVPRAVTIADRALKEERPGVYTGTVRLPVAGTYDVAFLLETPQILHCFSLDAKPNPKMVHTGDKVEIQYLNHKGAMDKGEHLGLRFRLHKPVSGEAIEGLKDVSLLYYRAPGRDRRVVRAPEVEPGVYEAPLAFDKPGAYYLYVATPSNKVLYGDLPFVTVRVGGRRKVNVEAIRAARNPSPEVIERRRARSLEAGSDAKAPGLPEGERNDEK